MVYAWFQAMHTRIDIFLKGLNDERLRQVCDEIGRILADIEAEGNCFDPHSLLSRLNRLPVGDCVDGGEYLFDMISQCKMYHSLTEGLFDITVSSVPHHANTINDILFHPGNQIGRAVDTLNINLSGFIKGYALDRIHRHLRTAGITDAVVNLGNSSILSMGDVPFSIKNSFITTSGHIPGRSTQIINPRLNEPVERHGSERVITKSGAEGEVLATACFIAGDSPQAMKLLASQFPGAKIF